MISGKNKEILENIFRIKTDDQKTTDKENSLVENQPELEPETKTAKKGNMKRGKKS